MPQNLFASLTSPSLVNLDANFTELYDATGPGAFLGNSASSAAMRYIGTANQQLGYRTASALIGGVAHHLAFRIVGGSTLYGIGIRPAADNTFAFTFANAADSVVGSIYTTATTTAYNTTSDRRLKCNIAPAESAGWVVDALVVVSHGWKAEPGARVRFGFIAQDLCQVFPEAVTEGDDGDEVQRTWAVDNSKLVPLLVAELQALRRRVAALEAACAP